MTDEGLTSLLCKAHANAQKSNKTAIGPCAQDAWGRLFPAGEAHSRSRGRETPGSHTRSLPCRYDMGVCPVMNSKTGCGLWGFGENKERGVQGGIPPSFHPACEAGCVQRWSTAWRATAGRDHEGVPKKITGHLTIALKSLMLWTNAPTDMRFFNNCMLFKPLLG